MLRNNIHRHISFIHRISFVCAVVVRFRGGVGRSVHHNGQGGQGQFEFSQANHGGLVVIKQACMIRWRASRRETAYAGKKPSTER